MPFVKSYLAKHSLYKAFVTTPPQADLKYIVVIPCYNEDQIIRTLNSLRDADRPGQSLEVIIVINASDKDPAEIHARNHTTENEINQWKDLHTDDRFQVHVIHLENLPAPKAGAGLARKIGMDEAIRRLNQLNRTDGWIVSLDADTTVAPDYFTAIEKTVRNDTRLNAGVVYFEHPLEGVEYDPGIYEAIVKYELFLRYYNQGLRWAGYPYAFQTIGSAFCVKAEAYVKQGGMNTKRAGEDFYFLNKIFQLGHLQDITGTAVYPSPRPSNRVLFGTGPEMIKWSQNNHQAYPTYTPEVFRILKRFMDRSENFYKAGKDQIDQLLAKQEVVMQDFLYGIDFERELYRINDNCNSLQSFRKHFFHWFNGLRIIRFIHTAHERHLDKVPLDQAASTMLQWMGYTPPDGYRQLLKFYRKIERTRPLSI